MNRRLFLKAAASVAFPVAFMPCSVEPLTLVPRPLDAIGPKESDTWTLDRLDFVAQFGEPMRMPAYSKTLWRPGPDGFICIAHAEPDKPFIRTEKWPAIEIRTSWFPVELNCFYFLREVDIKAGETLQVRDGGAYYIHDDREIFIGFSMV